ncbi:MAG: cell division protein FtsA [Leptospirales bacterium]|nr:cell division protein FtsA [Leptospirales bacterium]
MREFSAIDIGSSYVRVLMGRRGDENEVQVNGVGVAPSRGVRNGAIVNIEGTVQSIQEAAREAELMSGLVVEDAVVNVTGKHLRGENSRGVVAVTNRDRVVMESDVLRVIEGAQNIRIPADQDILHVLSREFIVDDQSGIRDPIGMTGVRLEAEVHIVTAGRTAVTNLKKAVNGAGIRILNLVMSSLASAEAVLTSGEKDLGVAVLDIGSGSTDIIMFVEGGVQFSSVVPLGGTHVTQDLSIGLKIPMETAESIKKNSGSAQVASVDPIEKIELPALAGRPPRWVLRQEIAAIIEPRMREIFELVDQELKRSGKKSSLAGGIVLTGGGSRVEGAVGLAEEVFALAARKGLPQTPGGFSERVEGPEFATAVGLLLSAAATEKREPGRSSSSGTGSGWVQKFKNWVSENL